MLQGSFLQRETERRGVCLFGSQEIVTSVMLPWVMARMVTLLNKSPRACVYLRQTRRQKHTHTHTPAPAHTQTAFICVALPQHMPVLGVQSVHVPSCTHGMYTPGAICTAGVSLDGPNADVDVSSSISSKVVY